MDAHSTNFTLCSFEPGYGFEADKIFGQTQIKEDIFNSTVKYINKLKSMDQMLMLSVAMRQGA